MADITTPKANSLLVVRRDKRPMQGNTSIIQGALVGVKAGFYGPADGNDATETIVGRALETVSNTGGAAGAKSFTVDFLRERHMILLANDGTNPVLAADREENCSALDTQTVRAFSPETHSTAGITYDVTSEGVWVEVGQARIIVPA